MGKIERYWGEVLDNEDPEFLGRIRVNCPQLLAGEAEMPDWIYPVFPFVDSETPCGMMIVPEVGSKVLLEIVEGDDAAGFSDPRWVGQGWKSRVPIPIKEPKDEYITRMAFYTRGEQLLIIAWKAGRERFLAVDKYGNGFEMVEIPGQGTELRIKLDRYGSQLEMKKDNIELIEGGSQSRLNIAGGIDLEAKDGDLNVDGDAVNLGAGADQAVPKADDLYNAIQTLLTVINTHTHPSPGAPPTQQAVMPPASGWSSDKVNVE